MPKNQCSVWSEIIDGRDKKTKKKYALTDAEIDLIERIIHGGPSHGINLHKLNGTHPPVYSAYVNDSDRLLFITHGSSLILIGKTPHKYNTTHALQPGVAERFYQKPWDDIKDNPEAYEVIASVNDIAGFIPNPAYTYEAPALCESYHQKFIILDDTQEGTLAIKKPAVVIGDPGSGKSSLCSIGIDTDLHDLTLMKDQRFIVYFTESPGLDVKMEQAWILDHPDTARLPEANQLLFLNYTKLLAQFGPDHIQGKTPIGKAAFEKTMAINLSDKNLKRTHPFTQTAQFKAIAPTLYHEFQLMAAFITQESYAKQSKLPEDIRDWAYCEYEQYLKNIALDGYYDPNLLVWEPTEQPFSSVHHDEALSASPVISLMLHRLTKNANIVSYADPNQDNEEIRLKSILDFIVSHLGLNGKPANKAILGATYRLPPNIADFANYILTIKQNVNGGKNEKSQSNQIYCVPDEQAYPGTLEWVMDTNLDALIEKLKNKVYVVITHQAYLEEAKRCFGDQVTVCTIEEARGQEFENAVLYRVTDPASKKQTTRHQKHEGKSLLTQLSEALAPMPETLQTKPNLAKGESDRRFEAYMNSVYIAISRITRHGYLVERGNPEKNELHRRLLARIRQSMENVVIDQETKTLNQAEVLQKAMQDLREGNHLQAKAGFLKAGKTEEEFNLAIETQQAKNIEAVKSALAARKPKPSPTPPKQPAKKTAPLKTRKNKKGKVIAKTVSTTATIMTAPTPTETMRVGDVAKKVLLTLETLDNAKRLFIPDKNKHITLIDMMSKTPLKDMLLIISRNNKNRIDYKIPAQNFKKALESVKVDTMIAVTDATGQCHLVPFVFYLIDVCKEIVFTQNYQHFLEKLKALQKDKFFSTPYHSMCFNKKMNLITLIGLVGGNFFVDLVESHPAFIGYVAWTSVERKENEAPTNVLINQTLVISDMATTDRMLALLNRHEATFLNKVVIEDLFVPRTANEYIFDCFLNTQGNKIFSLLNKKLLPHPLFNAWFTDDFLKGRIRLFYASNSNNRTVSRIRLLIFSNDFTKQCITSRKEVSALVEMLLECQSPAHAADIQFFGWSAFSNIVACNESNPVILRTLIEHHPTALQNLDESVWHAPTPQDRSLGLPEKNYVLMHVIIRGYPGTDIETFFKTHYPAVYEAAKATLKTTLLYPREISRKLNIKKLILDESTDALESKIKDKENYPLYSIGFRGEAIYISIMNSAKLREAFLRFFLNQSTAGKDRLFREFISYNNINELISIKTQSLNRTRTTTLPWVHFLYQDETGRRIIQGMMNYDPEGFIKHIKIESLIKACPLVYSEKNGRTLLHYLAKNEVALFSKLCEYSNVLKELPMDFFNRGYDGHTATVLDYLVQPLAARNPDQATCLLHLEAICNFLEAAPQVISSYDEKDTSFMATPAEEKQFMDNVLSVASSTPLLNRFLNALNQNPILLNGVVERYGVTRPLTSPELTQRHYRLNGLTAEEHAHYVAMIENEDVDGLIKFLHEPYASSILMQPLTIKTHAPDVSRMMIHLLVRGSLKSAFCATVTTLLKADPNHPIRSAFTKRMFSLYYFVFVGEERTPQKTNVLLDLMQDEHGCQLLEVLQQTQENFYAGIEASLFYNHNYVIKYGMNASLLFLASYEHPSACAQMIEQNKAIQKATPSSEYVTPYVMHDGQAYCILGNLMREPEHAQAAIDIITFNNYLIYRNVPATSWLEERYLFEHSSNLRYSLFDLLIIQDMPIEIMLRYLSDYSNELDLGFLCKVITLIDYSQTPAVHITMPRLFFLTLDTAFLCELKTILPLLTEAASESEAHQVYQALIHPSNAESDIQNSKWNTIAELAKTREGQILFVNLLKNIPTLVHYLKVADFQQPRLATHTGDTSEQPDHNLVFANFLFQSTPNDPDDFITNIQPNQALHHYVVHRASTKLMNDAENRFNAFVARCKENSVVSPDASYGDGYATQMIGLMCFLRKPGAPLQLNALLPNGSTVLFMALKHSDFQAAFIENIVEMADHVDHKALLIHFFNEININTNIISDDGSQNPLSRRLLLESNNDKNMMDVIYNDPESRYCITKGSIQDWLSPAYQYIDGTPLSHLDLLLSQEKMTTYAGAVIGRRIRDFTEHCKGDSDYLFDPIDTKHYQTNRITLMLSRTKLHNIVLVMIKNLSLPADKLKSVLLSEPYFEQCKLSGNLLTHLKDLSTGRQLLAEFKKIPALTEWLNKEVSVSLPISSALSQHGVFPSGGPDIIMSAEEAMHLIKALNKN